ncbi:prephenate dehydrogenase [Mammaliicoccus vitulinus]|uniref:prephenate dehydrogenase n=1 Tax=Mammaliicoccus vitulinus TaxID=71237 RepID=UPI003314B941
MQRIFIVGLGLIGGSLIQNIKFHHPNIHITGYDYFEKYSDIALSMKMIDEIATDFDSSARNADLIILATPVQQSIEYGNRLLEIDTKPGLIVTDTGSTKLGLSSLESKLLKKNIHLIGGHPMAGSHKSGVINSKKHLFENAYYVLIFDRKENEAAYSEVKHLLEHTKAKFIKMSAKEHDYVTGVVSHFPHVIASSLIHMNEENTQVSDYVKTLAAGGFRDITRIASSNADMWRDITLENREHLVTLMENWIEQMEHTKEMIQEGNPALIHDFYQSAKTYRDKLPIKEQGALTSTFDLYVDIPDKPGMISEVTRILGQNHISITNIRILEVREDIMGALRLSFKSSNDRDRAIEALNTFDTYTL